MIFMLLIIISIFGILALIFGALLSFITSKFSIKEQKHILINHIDMLLPQSQCAQCGYPGCNAYAKAISDGSPINKCIPGGNEVMLKIAKQINKIPQPMNEKIHIYEKKVAWINENQCVGCNKCAQICPVDAIVGTIHMVHTVINLFCTGCCLCIEPCPMDCIIMKPNYFTETILKKIIKN